MKAILKGIGVILVTLALAFVFIPKANAGTMKELRELLTGKSMRYDGTCHLDKNVMFAKDPKDNYMVRICKVFVNFNEEGEIYYALLFFESKPVKLIRIDKTVDPAKQDVLWTDRMEV